MAEDEESKFVPMDPPWGWEWNFAPRYDELIQSQDMGIIVADLADTKVDFIDQLANMRLTNELISAADLTARAEDVKLTFDDKCFEYLDLDFDDAERLRELIKKDLQETMELTQQIDEDLDDE